MRVYVQQGSTGLLLDPDKRWVKSKDSAKVFADSVAAFRFCERERIEAARLLLNFDEDDCDVTLDVVGRKENEVPYLEMLARTKVVLKNSQRLMEEQLSLASELDRLIAEGKERRKQYGFKPPGVRKPPEGG